MMFPIIFVIFPVLTNGMILKNGAYEEFVIKIAESVPEKDCANVIENLKTTLTSASQYMFSALDGRAFLRSATVLLPSSWSDSCVPSAVVPGSGELPDLTILPNDLTRGKIWTQQSLGCGQPGDQIYMSYEELLKTKHVLPRLLVKEFAAYRYGVFEEQGYFNDPIYPLCYYDDQMHKGKVTGCSDLPIDDNGICTTNSETTYNVTKLVDSKARSSIMFAAEAPSVSMFCDEGNHDRLAPTKHNNICQRRSVLDVILSHSDFAPSNLLNNTNYNQITDTTPKIIYKKHNLTRYVFVIENTKDMMQRESWSYLRLALRQWAKYLLPDNSEIGMVLSDGISSPVKALNIVSTSADRYGNSNRDKFYSSLPYTPNESMQPACMSCAIKEAVAMINERNRSHGLASNIIVVIAPGMEEDNHLRDVLINVKQLKIRIATINYPNIIRSKSLRLLAEETNGIDYTVFEQKLNVDITFLTTYFELHNVLYNIVTEFYSGERQKFPVEIHRREIVDDGRNSFTGSFILDENMGEPAQFNLFTHNSVSPLIKSLKLISPSHQIYLERNDRLIDFKIITLNTNISETGTWTYTIEAYSGNPQPHFLQIMATPKSLLVPIVNIHFRTHRNGPGKPLILLAEVKYGDLPVLGAKVEVSVSKTEYNETISPKFKLELLDTGAGDPDITKGDGVYTKYFSASKWGPGLYTFEVTVSDNGNTAYTWSDSSEDNSGIPCCGSSIQPKGVQTITPFQRILPKTTLKITSDEILTASQIPVGRIGDLKVQILKDDLKVRLSWTSPDMGGNTVIRYEIRYASSILDILEKFETVGEIWEDGTPPFPLAPGSETTATLDFSNNKTLLDKPLYFAVKAYQTSFGTISNFVRVLVPSPPSPPVVPPTYYSNENTYWPKQKNLGYDETVGTSLAKTMSVGLELILPVVIGIILLIVLLIVYCYFCVLKKRNRENHKSSKSSSMKNDKLNQNITIVPPQHVQNTYVPSNDIPDPHTIGVPVNNYAFDDERKKRYSLVNQQEQQLIEELKQQQQMNHYQHENPVCYGGLSIISNNRNGHTLSPYNSWSASQLLHEHERRHSPSENMLQEEQLMSHQEMLLNAPQMDHISLNGQNLEHMNLHYPQGHLPPPVPPLPAFNGNGYPPNYHIYGVHPPPQQQDQSQQIYQSMQRSNEPLVPFNSSLQGSMSSVNSGDKKRRNVTMV